MLFWQALFFVMLLLSSILAIPSIFASISIEKKLLSPREQIAYGTSLENITCPEGFVLMKKISDNSPACVKPDTAQKLIERGWGVLNEQTIVVQIKTTMFCNPWDNDLTQWYHSHNQTRMSESQGLEIIKNYYKKQGISVFDARYVNWRPHTLSCDACSCDSGKALQLLIENSDLEKMEKQGFSIVK